MRNDVKLGLAVGGVLLAVLIVYVLVVPGSEKPGADLATTVDPNAETTIQPEQVKERAPEAPNGATGDTPTTPVATNEPTGAPDTTEPAGQPTGTDTAKQMPKDPFDNQQVASADHDKGWDWNKLLNSTDTPELMNPIEVSTGGAPAEPTQIDTVRSTDLVNADPPAIEPTRRPEPQVAKPSAAIGRTYTVQAGETFSSIAASIYGNSRYYPHIMRANPSLDPTRLRAGTVINLPSAEQVKPAAVTDASIGTSSNSSSKSSIRQIDTKTEYRVQPGDSLERISIKLYGKRDRTDSIYETNIATIGDDPARLKVGQVLKLPEAPTVTVSAN